MIFLASSSSCFVLCQSSSSFSLSSSSFLSATSSSSPQYGPSGLLQHDAHQCSTKMQVTHTRMEPIFTSVNPYTVRIRICKIQSASVLRNSLYWSCMALHCSHPVLCCCPVFSQACGAVSIGCKLHQGALQSKCSASEDVHCCCVQTRCLPLRQPALLYNWKTCKSTLFKTSYTCLWFRLVWLMCTSPPALNWHIAHDCALLNHVPQPLLHFPSLHYPLLHYLFPCITHYCITCYCTLPMTALPVTVHCP